MFYYFFVVLPLTDLYEKPIVVAGHVLHSGRVGHLLRRHRYGIERDVPDEELGGKRSENTRAT